MFKPIYIKSKKNGFKVKIGDLFDIKREAIFYITPERVFTAAQAIGIDQSVLKRKSIQNCDIYEFRFIFGEKEIYRISKKDFLANAWLYPQKDNKDYVANSEVFEPKFVITCDIAKKISIKQKSKEEKNLELIKQGII